MCKYVVVMRQLPSHKAVVHSINELPDDLDESEREYAEDLVLNQEAKLVEKFPEFLEAEFWYQIVDQR